MTENTIKIGELARRTGMTLRALRFYEFKGLLHPQRRGSERLYSDDDEARLRYIQKLTACGVPLSSVKRALEATARGEDPHPEIIAAELDRLEYEAKEALSAIAAYREDAVARYLFDGRRDRL